MEIDKVIMNKEFWKLYNLLLEDTPQKSDVVVWLQGDRFDRAGNVLKIYKSKLAKIVVISGNDILIGHDTRVGENNINLLEMEDYLLENGLEKNDILVDGGALNTKDQAIHIMTLAKQKKWKSLILVSSAYNQPRALLTFLKQMKKINLNIRIFNYPVIMRMEEIPSGRFESVGGLCLSEIKKIRRYRDDLFPIIYGIKYLNNF